KIVMGEGSTIFVHNALTFAGGNAGDFRKMADDLEKISGEMAQMYAARTGLRLDEVQALMDAETILTAQEAVAKKFADEIANPKLDVTTVADNSPRAMTREQFEYELLTV